MLLHFYVTFMLLYISDMLRDCGAHHCKAKQMRTVDYTAFISIAYLKTSFVPRKLCSGYYHQDL